jgi:hypothetical protein
MFLNFTIQPYLDEWESAIADSLIRDPAMFVDHDVSSFIKMDSQSKASYLSTLTQNGLMTRNEGRRSLNLPEMEGADELTAQVNLAPLDKLGATPEEPEMMDDDEEENPFDEAAEKYLSRVEKLYSVAAGDTGA